MVREDTIVDLLLKHGELSIEKLAQLLEVSDSTIRRQIKSLDGNRFVQRTRSGIRLSSAINYESVSTYQWPADPAEARAIANRAVRMVERGDVVAISGGIICTQLALRLRFLDGITVVTNAVNIAAELTAIKGIQVKVTGGIVNTESYELVGPSVQSCLQDVYISKFFLGTNGLSAEHGVTGYDEAEALAARDMMRLSDSTILLADSRKFDKPNFARVCPISDIEKIVTTEKVPTAALTNLRDAGVDVVIAS